MEKGYIIFNADGSRPKTTLAAIESENYVQTIIQLPSKEVPKMFGAIAAALCNECDVPKEALHSFVDMACDMGDKWVNFCNMAVGIVGKMHDEIGECDSIDELKGKLREKLGINTEDEDDE